MPYCPNPDCPHRKRLDEPAEFNQGVTTCSDCEVPFLKLHLTLNLFENQRQYRLSQVGGPAQNAVWLTLMKYHSAHVAMIRIDLM